MVSSASCIDIAGQADDIDNAVLIEIRYLEPAAQKFIESSATTATAL